PDVHVRLRVLGNLSGMTESAFWQTMQDNRWVWLRDTAGKAITPAQLPQNVGLSEFQDDSARSIMYFGRDIGYTADGAVPFQEFYWGSWLRAHPELGLADWDQDDLADSLALVERITKAQVALPRDEVVDAASGYTAADLSTLTAWNDGKSVTKGEWAKLSAPYSSDKPGKLAYMTEYRKTLATEPAEPAEPADPGTDPTEPGDPGTTPTDPGTTPAEPGSAEPTDPTTVRGSVTVTGDLVAGGAVTVRGTDFAPDADARVEIHSDPVLLGTVRTDDSGAFTLAATVPTGLPAGTHTVVVVVGGVTVGSTTVTVVATDGAGTDGELAFTGAEGLVPAVVAALLALLVGTGIVVARRRRGHRV
ncbi:ParB/Srx family N-terminal domain-containing protein, partial [Curtobacterium luteum]|uniref:ParB/Srx family N-terminal domain-containing protein n=1 Tax=Curtobacterium luteum TaxID=33881 RepID=UPI000A776AF1